MEVLNQISIFIAIWVGIYGIDSWRREHLGKRRIELAEDVLALIYEAADVIRWMRHPVGFGNELEDVVRAEGESDDAFEARKSASLVFVRYNKRQDLFNKIYALRYRFMAQIGKSHMQAFDSFHGVTNDLFHAARMKAALLPRTHFRTPEQFEAHHQKLMGYDAVLWDSFGDDDPINPKLNKAVEDIEACCKRIIEGQGTLFSVLNKKLGREDS